MALKKVEVAEQVRDAVHTFRQGVLDDFIRTGIRAGRFWRDLRIDVEGREVILESNGRRYILEVKIRQSK